LNVLASIYSKASAVLAAGRDASIDEMKLMERLVSFKSISRAATGHLNDNRLEVPDIHEKAIVTTDKCLPVTELWQSVKADL
jgi:hypothetical protein